MRLGNKYNIILPLISALVVFPIPSGHANPDKCFEELSKTQKRWNRLRSEMDLSSKLERTVTRHLTKAVEFRHQGMKQRCLQQIEKARKKMDLTNKTE